MPPSFEDREYWDQRFRREDTFDWLLSGRDVCQIVKSELAESGDLKPRILHCGCGNSELSFLLEEVVDEPTQVHNVDFSQVAVDAGIAKEQKRASQESGTESRMRWSQVDLLSLTSVRNLLIDNNAPSSGSYSVVVDKSTSDSIACGEDIGVNLPYPPKRRDDSLDRQAINGEYPEAIVHPLHILAVHLTALTKIQTSRWIAISYTEDRFPFLPPLPSTKRENLRLESTVAAGFLDPAELWKLEKKWKVSAPMSTVAPGQRYDGTKNIVHTPDVGYWVYVLRRIDGEACLP